MLRKSNTLLTAENLHNFHFDTTKFFSAKWKKRDILLRQIAYDTRGVPETWFAIDRDTMELFIYFGNFGTKQNPRLLKIANLPEEYQKALVFLADIENNMLSILHNESSDDLRNIKTGGVMKMLLKAHGSQFPEKIPSNAARDN